MAIANDLDRGRQIPEDDALAIRGWLARRILAGKL